jgi:hypothetical protein
MIDHAIVVELAGDLAVESGPGRRIRSRRTAEDLR